MKSSWVIIICFLILLCGGCSEKQTEQEAKKQAASIKMMDIPLDSALVDAKVMLTRNFYFVMDGSGSMDEGFSGQDKFSRKIEGAKWATEEFLKNVPEDVNLGLYVFDNHVGREVIPLGPGNRNKFLTAIHAINPNGGTPLGDAIRFGVDQLVKQYQRQLGYGEFRLIVVTDGVVTAGTMSASEAALYALQHRVPMYTIGLCVEENHPLRHWSVSYKAAESSEDLKKGLEEVASESSDFDPASFDSTSVR